MSNNKVNHKRSYIFHHSSWLKYLKGHKINQGIHLNFSNQNRKNICITNLVLSSSSEDQSSRYACLMVLFSYLLVKKNTFDVDDNEMFFSQTPPLVSPSLKTSISSLSLSLLLYFSTNQNCFCRNGHAITILFYFFQYLNHVSENYSYG